MISAQVQSQTAIDIRSLVLPRARWEVSKGPDGRPCFAPQKGTWYGRVFRGRAAHDVLTVAMIACPACGGASFLSHSPAAAKVVSRLTGMPCPVAHRVDYLGKVSPDLQCGRLSCSFHRRVFLDRWNKTKALYAIAYIEGEHGAIQIDYTHAIDRREARFHFGKRKEVRIIDMAPAVGFYVDEKTGRMTAD